MEVTDLNLGEKLEIIGQEFPFLHEVCMKNIFHKIDNNDIIVTNDSFF